MSERSPVARVASALGCTEGQAYTLVIGAALTVLTVWVGIPPTLRDRVTSVRTIDAEELEAPAPPATPDPRVGEHRERRAPLAPVPRSTPSPARTSAASGDTSPRTARRVEAPPQPVRSFGITRIAARVDQPGAPDGIAVDEQQRTYVATNNGLGRGGEGPSKLFRYTSDGALDGDVTVEGQSSMRTTGLTALVRDAEGFVFVLDTAPARVLRIDLRNGVQRMYTQVPDLPACGLVASTDACEPGAHDEAPLPRGVALDNRGSLYVTDANQELIWRVMPSGAIAPWAVFDDREVPAGVALDRDGDVVVMLSRSLDAAPTGGAVIGIDVRPDGTAGRRTTIAETEPLSGAAGIAVTPTGEIVVALADADTLLLLAGNGDELDRLDADRVGGDTGIALDAPTGVVIEGGRALVTNQSPSDASGWVVFSVELRR